MAVRPGADLVTRGPDPAARGVVHDRGLPASTSLLAVCAHPDDESFGLGAVLAAFADAGTRLSLLCFTRGEASTLHGAPDELVDVRARELAAAATCLGVGRVELLDLPDGRLAAVPLSELAGHVRRVAREVAADTLLVFDEGGITDHADHRRATEAALAATDGDGPAVLAWVVPDAVARQLNEELGTALVGRVPEEIDLELAVDRGRQLAAVRHHPSQATGNRVLSRRLELTGGTEWLRYLRVGPRVARHADPRATGPGTRP